MTHTEFIPRSRTVIELLTGKKLLATIIRQKSGSHFCVIENRDHKGKDGRIKGKPGFHKPTLQEAKDGVREVLFA